MNVRHGMMEIMFSHIDIHKESTLELEKENYISEHGSYFMNTSSNRCSHEKSPESIGLSNIATHEIFNPSYSLFIKLLKGWL
jgi:endonuclease IV